MDSLRRIPEHISSLITSLSSYANGFKSRLFAVKPTKHRILETTIVVISIVTALAICGLLPSPPKMEVLPSIKFAPLRIWKFHVSFPAGGAVFRKIWSGIKYIFSAISAAWRFIVFIPFRFIKFVLQLISWPFRVLIPSAPAHLASIYSAYRNFVVKFFGYLQYPFLYIYNKSKSIDFSSAKGFFGPIFSFLHKYVVELPSNILTILIDLLRNVHNFFRSKFTSLSTFSKGFFSEVYAAILGLFRLPYLLFLWIYHFLMFIYSTAAHLISQAWAIVSNLKGPISTIAHYIFAIISSPLLIFKYASKFLVWSWRQILSLLKVILSLFKIRPSFPGISVSVHGIFAKIKDWLANLPALLHIKQIGEFFMSIIRLPVSLLKFISFCIMSIWHLILSLATGIYSLFRNAFYIGDFVDWWNNLCVDQPQNN